MSTLDPWPALLGHVGEIASTRPPGPLALVRAAGGRAHVRGASLENPAVSQLLAWLRERPDVVRVDHRERHASLDIEYHEATAAHGAAEAPFVCSLRDRLFTLSQPTAATTAPLVELTHSLDGRARLRMRGAADDSVLRLATLLRDEPGVNRASASLASQSVLVTFDPAVTTAEALVRAALASSPAAWPSAPDAPKKTAWGSLR